MTITDAEIRSLRAIISSIQGLATAAVAMIEQAEEPAPEPEQPADNPLKKRLAYMGAENEEPPAKGA